MCVNRITLPTEFHSTCHLSFFQCRICSFSTSSIFASHVTLIWLSCCMKRTYISSLESNRKIASRFTLGLHRKAYCFPRLSFFPAFPYFTGTTHAQWSIIYLAIQRIRYKGTIHAQIDVCT
jgi:hypothetical protein